MNFYYDVTGFPLIMWSPISPNSLMFSTSRVCYNIFWASELDELVIKKIGDPWYIVSGYLKHINQFLIMIVADNSRLYWLWSFLFKFIQYINQPRFSNIPALLYMYLHKDCLKHANPQRITTLTRLSSRVGAPGGSPLSYFFGVFYLC